MKNNEKSIETLNLKDENRGLSQTNIGNKQTTSSFFK